VSGLSFLLGPPTSTEPPKEKPPPPPAAAEITDEELSPVSHSYICMCCKYLYMSFSRKRYVSFMEYVKVCIALAHTRVV